MKEGDLQSRIIEVATLYSWRFWHVPMPVRPIGGGEFVPDPRGAGLPDLILIHDDQPRLIFAELKGTGGELSDAQRAFLQAAKKVADYTTEGAAPAEFRDEPHVYRTLGVYVVTPETEDAFIEILRSKVLS